MIDILFTASTRHVAFNNCIVFVLYSTCFYFISFFGLHIIGFLISRILFILSIEEVPELLDNSR